MYFSAKKWFWLLQSCRLLFIFLKSLNRKSKCKYVEYFYSLFVLRKSLWSYRQWDDKVLFLVLTFFTYKGTVWHMQQKMFRSACAFMQSDQCFPFLHVQSLNMGNLKKIDSNLLAPEWRMIWVFIVCIWLMVLFHMMSTMLFNEILHESSSVNKGHMS